MTRPRSQQISLDDTAFYLLTTRCFRRAFLAGFDQLTNRSYEHRRQQIQDDMLRLATVFYIDIAAFAVLSNHYHMVVHVRRDVALADSPESIVERAHQLIAGNDVTQRFLNNQPLENFEHEQLNLFVDTWRKRLYEISWLMKFLNEGVARRANQEDDCTGHFWESRYKSQALLDEKAVLSAMAYVDLNPIRAGMAATPWESEYTSIKQRIDCCNGAPRVAVQGKKEPKHQPLHPDRQPDSLMRFVGDYREPMPSGLAYKLVDYLELVDWTGRAIRDGKRGYIREELPPLLNRLDISGPQWLELSTHYRSRFKGIVGSVETLQRALSSFGLRRCPNLRNSKLLFG